VGSLGVKAEKIQLISFSPPHPNQHIMPTAAELPKQMADKALILAETEKAEQEEAKKVAEAETERKAAEAEEKKKVEEAEVKRKADEVNVEKTKKAMNTSSKEADEAQKAKVRTLATTKEGKEVEKSTEVEVETKTRQDCDSCARKELICEWRVVSNYFIFYVLFWS
jgi:colicin import membrane protein